MKFWNDEIILKSENIYNLILIREIINYNE